VEREAVQASEMAYRAYPPDATAEEDHREDVGRQRRPLRSLRSTSGGKRISGRLGACSAVAVHAGGIDQRLLGVRHGTSTNLEASAGTVGRNATVDGEPHRQSFQHPTGRRPRSAAPGQPTGKCRSVWTERGQSTAKSLRSCCGAGQRGASAPAAPDDSAEAPRQAAAGTAMRGAGPAHHVIDDRSARGGADRGEVRAVQMQGSSGIHTSPSARTRRTLSGVR
jgi:hypothetical protein